MKKKRPKNGYAKALRTPRYKMRVIPDKRRKEFLISLREQITQELERESRNSPEERND